MLSGSAASTNIDPRKQGFRYLHGRITSSPEIGTLIQSIADFSPRSIIKLLKHNSMQYIQSITEKHQPSSSSFSRHYYKQWPASMCYISHSHPSIEGLQSSLRSVKSCQHILEIPHHNWNNTDHRILNQTYSMSSVRCWECLRYNGLSQSHFLNVISGHLRRVLLLPPAACALNAAWETQVNPSFCADVLRSNLHRMTSYPRW